MTSVSDRPVARNGSPPSRRGQARREQLIDAAIQQFRERGFASTTIDDIGTAAGVTGPAVYHHFRSKQQLLAAAFWRVGDEFFKELPVLLAKNLSPDERLEMLIRRSIAIFLTYEAAVPLLYVEDHNLDPEDLVTTNERRDRIAAQWQDVLSSARPDLDHAQIVDMGNGLISLLSAHTIRPTAHTDEHDMVEYLVQMALAVSRGTRKPSRIASGNQRGVVSCVARQAR